MLFEKIKSVSERVWIAITENPPSQSTQEVIELCERLEVLKPATVLEIGVYHGGTMNIWSKFAAKDAWLIGVDIVNLAGDKFKGTCFISGSSFDPSTVCQVIDKLQGRQVDFLFIDGLHTYEACLADLKNYAPLVRSGGIIALHDAVGNDQVKKAIEHFSEATGWRSTTFFRDKPEEGVMGIQMFVKP